jgi:hypothetical protein
MVVKMSMLVFWAVTQCEIYIPVSLKMVSVMFIHATSVSLQVHTTLKRVSQLSVASRYVCIADSVSPKIPGQR